MRQRLKTLAALVGLIALAVLGCSDGPKTEGIAKRPPEADAGEKASFEFMKKNMQKSGLTKPAQ